MTSSAPSEVALQAIHEKWLQRIPPAWLIAIAFVVLIAISAARLAWGGRTQQTA
jgi:hypothetical protein